MPCLIGECLQAYIVPGGWGMPPGTCRSERVKDGCSYPLCPLADPLYFHNSYANILLSPDEV